MSVRDTHSSPFYLSRSLVLSLSLFSSLCKVHERLLRKSYTTSPSIFQVHEKLLRRQRNRRRPNSSRRRRWIRQQILGKWQSQHRPYGRWRSKSGNGIKYLGNGKVNIALMGDGAANQVRASSAHPFSQSGNGIPPVAYLMAYLIR